VSAELATPGLPGPLPPGERLLWQGSPSWKVLALRTFHGRMIAVYFGLLLAWVAVDSLSNGAGAAEIGLAVLRFAPFALVAVALVLLLAWLTARTTVYTVTNRRIVLSYGVAFPMSLNLPFARIAAAGVKVFKDGTADIPLQTVEGDKIAYLMLWPHARPWRISRPEPTLRAVPDGARVAGILARALAAAADQPLPAVTREPKPSGSAASIPTAAAA
jgi:hypothetical protein